MNARHKENLPEDPAYKVVYRNPRGATRYEYECKSCGKTQEESHSAQDEPTVKCKHCRSTNTYRVLRTCTFHLKGRGFPSRELKLDREIQKRMRSWQKAGEARVRSMRLGICLKSGTIGWLKRDERSSPRATSGGVKSWVKRLSPKRLSGNETKFVTDERGNPRRKNLFDKGE